MISVLNLFSPWMCTLNTPPVFLSILFVICLFMLKVLWHVSIKKLYKCRCLCILTAWKNEFLACNCLMHKYNRTCTYIFLQGTVGPKYLNQAVYDLRTMYLSLLFFVFLFISDNGNNYCNKISISNICYYLNKYNAWLFCSSLSLSLLAYVSFCACIRMFWKTQC